MRRRRFIQLAVIAGGGALLRSPLEVLPALGANRHPRVNGTIFRGDRRGRIFSSANRGATWDLHTFLGPGYAITRISDDSGRVVATVRFRGGAFPLTLGPDGKRWHTA